MSSCCCKERAAFFLLLKVSLLLLSSTSSAAEPPFLGEVRMDLYGDDHIRVVVGNPGRLVKLRLSFHTDYSVLYGSPSEASSTFTSSTPDGDRGTEIFYIGRYKLRMPVVTLSHDAYNADLDVTTNDTEMRRRRRSFFDNSGTLFAQRSEQLGSVSASDSLAVLGTLPGGELALGPGSIVWRYWKSFNVAFDSLTLGAYDPYVQQNHRYRGPIVPILYRFPLWTGAVDVLEGNEAQPPSSSSTTLPSSKWSQLPRGAPIVPATIDGADYAIVIDHGSFSTYIPKHLLHYGNFDISFWSLSTVNRRNSASQRHRRDVSARNSNSDTTSFHTAHHGTTRRLAARHGRRTMTDESCSTLYKLLDIPLPPSANLESSEITNNTMEHNRHLCSDEQTFHFSTQDHRIAGNCGSDSRNFAHSAAFGWFPGLYALKRRLFGGASPNDAFFSAALGGGGTGDGCTTVFDSPFDNVLVLGSYTLRHMSVFVDWKERKMVISPSYYFVIESKAAYYVALVVALILCLQWMVSANSDNCSTVDQTRRRFGWTELACMQIAGALVTCIGLCISVSGYEAERFVYHMTRMPGSSYCVVALVCVVMTNALVALLLAASTLSTSGNSRHGHPRHGREGAQLYYVRRLAAETALIGVLWVSLLQNHQTPSEMCALVAVSWVATMNSAIIALRCRSARLSTSGTYAAAYTCLASIFYYVLNVVPFVGSVWGDDHPYLHLISIIVVVCTVCIPGGSCAPPLNPPS